MHFDVKLTVSPTITRSQQQVGEVFMTGEPGEEVVNLKRAELGYCIGVGMHKFQFLLLEGVGRD